MTANAEVWITCTIATRVRGLTGGEAGAGVYVTFGSAPASYGKALAAMANAQGKATSAPWGAWSGYWFTGGSDIFKTNTADRFGDTPYGTARSREFECKIWVPEITGREGEVGTLVITEWLDGSPAVTRVSAAGGADYYYTPRNAGVNGWPGLGESPVWPGGWTDYKSPTWILHSSMHGFTGVHSVSVSAVIIYGVNPPIDPCQNFTVSNLTFDGATISNPDYPDAVYQWGVEGDEIGDTSDDGVLTGLEPDTTYWYQLLSYCTGKRYYFKTKPYDDPVTHNITVVTLGVDDWWWMGGGIGTIRGLIKHTGTTGFYGYFGFQFGTSSSFTTADTYWIGNIGWESDWIPTDPFIYPFQQVHNHLLPDRTYYYRAIWHHHRPPYTVDLYGATLSFSGVSSILGFGTNHVTAKRAEDDISKLAAGRYYMDKSGVLQYESYQRRLA